MLYAEIDEAKLRMYDRQGDIEEGVERGIEMGMVKGMERGRMEGMEKIIALLEQGITLDEIKRMRLSEQPARR